MFSSAQKKRCIIFVPNPNKKASVLQPYHTMTINTAAAKLPTPNLAGSGAGAANPDLLPTTRTQRNSTAWEIASLWISLVVGIPSYYIAGTLVEKGMTWWQGLLVVVSAKAILLGPLFLLSHPGARYGIPFPILARAAFGVRGAHVPSLLRALVACGWFGIETWFGGQALLLLLPSSLTHSPLAAVIPFLATSPLDLISFALFWTAQITVVLTGIRGIRTLEKYSAPVLVVLAFCLLGWAYAKAGGFGRMLSLPSRLSPAEFWPLFFPSLTANVGSWGAFALSVADFTRYARGQRDQVLGQAGLPFFMGTFAFIGLAVTSSTEVIYGRLIPNPIRLLAEIGGTVTSLVTVPGISLAIFTTNIPANIVAPANALVSFSPSTFSFRGAAVVTALVGAVVFQPWRILNSPDSFVYTWLVGYSAVMGPLAGIVLADYYVIRGMVLDVEDLYSAASGGGYYYTGGYNLVAMVCLVASTAPIVPGFLQRVGMVENLPGLLVFVYNIGWFFGFFTGGVLYVLVFWLVGRFAKRGGGYGSAGKNNVKISSSGCGPSRDLRDPLLPTLVES